MSIKSLPTLSIPGASVGLVYFEFCLYSTLFRGKPCTRGTQIPRVTPCGAAKNLISGQCRRLPAMQEMWIRSLGWEDCLEEEMLIHSSVLAWEIL